MKTRWDEPRSMLNGRAGSSGGSWGRRGSSGKPSMTATGSARHEGSTWRTGLGPTVGNRSEPGSWIFPSTASILSLIQFANPDGADSEPYESVWVCSLEIIPQTIHSGEAWKSRILTWNWKPTQEIRSQIRGITVLWKAALSRKRPTFERMGIELSCADMPIPEILRDGWQSVLFDYCDIHKVLWNSTPFKILTFEDILQD